MTLNHARGKRESQQDWTAEEKTGTHLKHDSIGYIPNFHRHNEDGQRRLSHWIHDHYGLLMISFYK